MWNYDLCCKAVITNACPAYRWISFGNRTQHMQFLKTYLYRNRRRNKKGIVLFMLGMILGMTITYRNRSILLTDIGIFNEENLACMKQMSIDSYALFCYVLRRRIALFLVAAVLSTTYLALVICGLFLLWVGYCYGCFLSILALQYGLRGIVLAGVCLFPQMLFYLVAVWLMLQWSKGMYYAIYHYDETGIQSEKKLIIGKALRLFGIAFFTVLGCLAESFINPGVLELYLKIF